MERIMGFWVSLIKVVSEPSKTAMRSLEVNCTHIDNNYWIMEGDVDCLRDQGVKVEVLGEGTVGCLAELGKQELKEICKDALGYEIGTANG